MPRTYREENDRNDHDQKTARLDKERLVDHSTQMALAFPLNNLYAAQKDGAAGARNYPKDWL
ncbi:MAG: hypothetical protein KKD73_10105 [Proteobacteria bacterium]|nr:hypothetical protein [Pseudomonadota bacterium]